MPLFFLNQRYGPKYICDPEGAYFESIEHARLEAIEAAREMMAQMVLTGYLDLTSSFEIVDQDHHPLRVSFSEALTIRGMPTR